LILILLPVHSLFSGKGKFRMTIAYRKGTIEETFAVYQVFTQALPDLGERTNVIAITGGNDPVVLQSLWEGLRPSNLLYVTVL
jgi:hypothetical protein